MGDRKLDVWRLLFGRAWKNIGKSCTRTGNKFKCAIDKSNGILYADEIHEYDVNAYISQRRTIGENKSYRAILQKLSRFFIAELSYFHSRDRETRRNHYAFITAAFPPLFAEVPEPRVDKSFRKRLYQLGIRNTLYGTFNKPLRLKIKNLYLVKGV